MVMDEDEWEGIEPSSRKFEEKCCYYFQPRGEGNAITAIFENPTHLEKLANRPVVGNTGVNLYLLLNYIGILDSNLSKEFDGQLDKLKICIVNAMRVFGDVANFLPVAKKWVIADNFPALRQAVRGCSLLLLFGKSAELAYRLLRFRNCVSGIKAISVYHLSDTALCRLNKTSIECYLKQRKCVLKDADIVGRSGPQLKLIADYISAQYDNTECSFVEISEFTKFCIENGLMVWNANVTVEAKERE